MATTHNRFYQNLSRVRTGVQIFSVLFLFAVPVLNWLGVRWIIGTLYSISIGELDIADPAMALQTILLTKDVYLPLLIAAALPMVLAFVFGRIFCSWMCPQNTFSEWIALIQKRYFKKRWMQTHRAVIANNPHPAWYWSIFAGLVLLVVVTGLPLLSYLSMPGIISSQIAQSILGMGMGLEAALVVIILTAETVIARRFWCKYLCPVGAMLALFNARRTLRLHHDETLCDCKRDAEPCHYVCPLALAPKQAHVYPYCFNCGLCVAVCEKTGKRALTFRFGGNSSQKPSEANMEAAPLLKIISRKQESE